MKKYLHQKYYLFYTFLFLSDEKLEWSIENRRIDGHKSSRYEMNFLLTRNGKTIEYNDNPFFYTTYFKLENKFGENVKRSYKVIYNRRGYWNSWQGLNIGVSEGFKKTLCTATIKASKRILQMSRIIQKEIMGTL